MFQFGLYGSKTRVHAKCKPLELVILLEVLLKFVAEIEYHGGCVGVDHLHHVLHCDLKPNNILLDEEMVAHC